MIRAIAIDDEPPALRVITHFSARTGLVDLLRTFTSTSEAYRFLEEEPVDLLFLDINMPALSGIEFYKNIPQSCPVIFTTAYAEYAVEGFNLSAVDYLLKPFTYDRFMQAATRADEYLRFLRQEEAARPLHLYVRADYSLHKILLSDILYIEGLDDYLRIHLDGARPVVARMTMKGLMQKLPQADFLRVHRSFIVPLARIGSVRNKVITCAGKEIPVGASYEQEFFRRFPG